MNKYRFLLLLLLAFVLTASLATAQNNKDSLHAVEIKDMVLNRNYIFKAQSVTPQAGRLRQLTTEYDLQVSKDKIVSYLPYFGRAYSAPIGSSSNGIEFTSNDFEYTSKDKKKGGWDITIKIKDVQDHWQMQLSIFDNGTSSLQVTSNNRQPISFHGYITSPPEKK